MEAVGARQVSCVVWHQTRPRNPLLAFTDPASFPGRYHRVGEPGCWYASLTERGAWAELFRHWGQDEVSPFEIRRRVGRARVEALVVLDLTDPDVREQLGVSVTELIANDTSRCQDLAVQAQAAGFEGVLAPSGALDGERTLVVFAEGMAKVTAEHSRVQRPPIRMIDVLPSIRLPEEATHLDRYYQGLVALAKRLGRRVQRR